MTLADQLAQGFAAEVGDGVAAVDGGGTEDEPGVPMAGGSVGVGVGAVAGGAASAVAAEVDVTSTVMEAAPVAGAEVGMAVHWVEGRPGVAC
jgi:hypothetical protein